jgi:hypothetical protein
MRRFETMKLTKLIKDMVGDAVDFLLVQYAKSVTPGAKDFSSNGSDE